MKLYDILEPNQTPVANSNKDDFAIGIDLGTTNSLVSLTEDGINKIILGDDNAAIHPSIIYFDEEGNIVDKSSASQYISSVKRLIGKNTDNIAQYKKYYDVEEFDDGNFAIKIGNKLYSPIELSAEILKQLKIRAEKFLNKPVTKAVITVPAYFGELERSATKDAALLAGFDVLRLINEPTAAAIAYGLDKKSEGKFLVYDLGGGTFDVSILHMENNVFQVVATKGDVELGGDDYDYILSNDIKSFFPNMSSQEIKNIAKQIKEGLTYQEEAAYGDYKITRQKFEEITNPLTEKTLKIIHSIMHEADLNYEDIDGVILVGGSTRMPVIGNRLREIFPAKIFDDLNPDEIVAIGAGIQAHSLIHDSHHLLIDVNPISIGLEVMGGMVEKIIPRNSTIPISVTKKYTTYQDGQTGMIFNIVQGDREMVKDCRSIAKFELKGIPPMKAGMVAINVKFMLDADGMLTISAWDHITGLRKTVHVNTNGTIPKEVMRKMIIDAIENSENDFKERKLAEKRVEFSRVLDQIENISNDIKEYLDSESIKDLTDAISQARTKLSIDDISVLDEMMQNFEKTAEFLAEKQLEIAFQIKVKGLTIDELEKLTK